MRWFLWPSLPVQRKMFYDINLFCSSKTAFFYFTLLQLQNFENCMPLQSRRVWKFAFFPQQNKIIMRLNKRSNICLYSYKKLHKKLWSTGKIVNLNFLDFKNHKKNQTKSLETFVKVCDFQKESYDFGKKNHTLGYRFKIYRKSTA